MTRKQKMREEGMGPAERGHQRYMQKDYEGALSAFTEAVEMSSGHLLINALDNRAATFEKLGQLKSALWDAKRMIETMPKRSKGYLRCGKILQVQKQNELALLIYERGLEKVKIDADKDRTVLQQQYNKLRRAMNPKKSLDPLQYLPLELAVMVCEHLTMRDKVTCLAVSKAWKGLLESEPDLWTTLDTSHCRRPMSLKSLKPHLKRSNYSLDSAVISIKAAFDAPKMRFLTKSCEGLRELKIRGVGMIGESLSASMPAASKLESLSVSDLTEVSIATVQSCLGSCQNIVDMAFMKIQSSPVGFRTGVWPRNEHIKRLELRCDKRDKRPLLDITGLRDATPNLISAILPEWKITAQRFDLASWTHLEYLDLTNTQITQFPKFPMTLKHLILSDNPLLAVHNQEELTVLPLLETFNCHSTALDATTIRNITSKAIEDRRLKKLFIGGRINDSRNTPVEEEFPRSDTVEELSLALLHLNDRHAIQIAGLYPNLRKLDLSSTQITGVAIREFVVNMGIKSLKLNECHNISPDAVEWARGKGIEIMFNFPSRLAGLQRFGESAFTRAL